MRDGCAQRNHRHPILSHGAAASRRERRPSPNCTSRCAPQRLRAPGGSGGVRTCHFSYSGAARDVEWLRKVRLGAPPDVVEQLDPCPVDLIDTYILFTSRHVYGGSRGVGGGTVGVRVRRGDDEAVSNRLYE